MTTPVEINNEELFSHLLKDIADPVLMIECNTYRILKANTAALEIYGYINHHDLSRNTFFDLFAQPDVQKKSCQDSSIVMENVSFIRQNGEIFHGDVHGFLIPSEGAKNPLYLVLIKNISSPSDKGYHNAIWQSVLHNIPLVLWVKDTQGHFSDINEHFLKLHGLRREEVIGRTEFSLFSEAYAHASGQEDQCVLYSRAKIHKEESFTKQDTTLWFETYKIPIINTQDQIIGIAGFSININERKEFDKQLKAKQEWLETTLRSIGEAVITIDGKGYITSINPIAETYLAVRQAQSVGRPLHEVVFIRSPLDNQIESPFSLVERNGPSTFHQKDRILVNNQGIEIPIEYKLTPILNHEGFLTGNGFVLVITNVSHHKTREQNLLAENKLMREFLEASPNAIFFTNREGKVVLCNEEFCQLIGTTPQKAQNKAFWSFFQNEDQSHLKKEFEGLSQRIKLKNHIFTIIGHQGTPHNVELSANLVKNSREDSYLFILNDITERMNHMRLLYKQQSSLDLVKEVLQTLCEDQKSLPVISQKIAAFMDIQRLFVYKWRTHDQILDPVYLWSHTANPGPVPPLESKHFSQDWIGMLLQQQHLVISRDLQLNPYEKATLEKTGHGSVLFLPLWLHQQFWGALGIHDTLQPHRQWDEIQISFFKSVAPLFTSSASFYGK